MPVEQDAFRFPLPWIHRLTMSQDGKISFSSRFDRVKPKTTHDKTCFEEKIEPAPHNSLQWVFMRAFRCTQVNEEQDENRSETSIPHPKALTMQSDRRRSGAFYTSKGRVSYLFKEGSLSLKA
ncbi:hypothetical protein HPP92_026685 [Vanilla planifolia]|uniref:Uncharacterized protein n=1 Tax=Vanilla planifolia TaxID=51239 RepID=A0A835U6N9_VANPL|nr:hypothetical protein HPP92_026685 [Vanilla planifolia]